MLNIIAFILILLTFFIHFINHLLLVFLEVLFLLLHELLQHLLLLLPLLALDVLHIYQYLFDIINVDRFLFLFFFHRRLFRLFVR